MKIRDLDNLSSRLHGRRSRSYYGERLNALCALKSPADLGSVLFAGAGLLSARQVQLRLAEDLAAGARALAAEFEGARARYLEWTAARLYVENIKVVIRTLAAGYPPESAGPLLMPLPPWPELCGAAFSGTATPEALAAALPAGVLRHSLERAYAAYPGKSGSFFYETALDKGYLTELLARLAGLRREDGEQVRPLVRQEITVFNLMLAARGRFFYGLDKKELLSAFVPGCGISGRIFSAMLDAPGVGDLRALVPGLAVESGPPEPDPGLLEALAWNRYARLALRAFRGSSTGFGLAAAYLALRRLEAANLATTAEGLRLGVAAEGLRGRVFPRTFSVKKPEGGG